MVEVSRDGADWRVARRPDATGWAWSDWEPTAQRWRHELRTASPRLFFRVTPHVL
jgi:hypothetical protein